jgi:Flp pilus assembly protein TadD
VSATRLWRWGVALGCVALPVVAGCSHIVILHDPLTAAEHSDLGVAYESTGKLDLAAREYRRSLKLDPRQSRTRVNLGNVQAARGQWRSAEKSYRRALADSATNADAMNNLAVALLRQGRRGTEARALAGRAIAIGGARDSIYRATLAEVDAALPR